MIEPRGIIVFTQGQTTVPMKPAEVRARIAAGEIARDDLAQWSDRLDQDGWIPVGVLLDDAAAGGPGISMRQQGRKDWITLAAVLGVGVAALIAGVIFIATTSGKQRDPRGSDSPGSASATNASSASSGAATNAAAPPSAPAAPAPSATSQSRAVGLAEAKTELQSPAPTEAGAALLASAKKELDEARKDEAGALLEKARAAGAEPQQLACLKARYYRLAGDNEAEIRIVRYMVAHDFYTDSSSMIFDSRIRLGTLLARTATEEKDRKRARELFEEATEVVQKVLDSEPDSFDGNMLMGLCYFSLERQEDAYIHFKRAYDRFKTSPEAVTALLTVALYKKDGDLISKMSDELQAINPELYASKFEKAVLAVEREEEKKQAAIGRQLNDLARVRYGKEHNLSDPVPVKQIPSAMRGSISIFKVVDKKGESVTFPTPVDGGSIGADTFYKKGEKVYVEAIHTATPAGSPDKSILIITMRNGLRVFRESDLPQYTHIMEFVTQEGDREQDGKIYYVNIK